MVEQMGVEPTTPTMRTWCSSQLSYCPDCSGYHLIYCVFSVFQAENHFFLIFLYFEETCLQKWFSFDVKMTIRCFVKWKNEKKWKINLKRFYFSHLHILLPGTKYLVYSHLGMVMIVNNLLIIFVKSYLPLENGVLLNFFRMDFGKFPAGRKKWIRKSAEKRRKNRIFRSKRRFSGCK